MLREKNRRFLRKKPKSPTPILDGASDRSRRWSDQRMIKSTHLSTHQLPREKRRPKAVASSGARRLFPTPSRSGNGAIRFGLGACAAAVAQGLPESGISPSAPSRGAVNRPCVWCEYSNGWRKRVVGRCKWTQTLGLRRLDDTNNQETSQQSESLRRPLLHVADDPLFGRGWHGGPFWPWRVTG